MGRAGFYGVMDKDPACIVIPLERTAEGEFVWLVRQFRYTVGGTFYELPQGGWEVAEVDAEELARGELRGGDRAPRRTDDAAGGSVDCVRRDAAGASRVSG